MPQRRRQRLTGRYELLRTVTLRADDCSGLTARRDLLQEAPERCVTLLGDEEVVEVHPQDLQPRLRIALVQRDEVGRFAAARRTGRVPEIEQHDLAALLRQTHGLPLQIGEGKIGRRPADVALLVALPRRGAGRR